MMTDLIGFRKLLYELTAQGKDDLEGTDFSWLVAEFDRACSPENIDRAGNESIEIFKTRFTFAPVDQKDKPTKFEVPMSKDKCEAIELGIKQFMSEHSIDNESYALELIVAEVRERPTLVGFVQDSIPRLTKAVMEAQDFEELRSLIVDHLRAMGELLKVCCGEDGSN